jgi:CheY-like chemotaxis protein
VKGLIEAHGGRVEARSEGTGRGLEITATLPLATARPREAPRAPEAPGRSLSLVLIEDERDVRDSLADLLRFEGYQVAIAADARTGIELTRSLRPDAVLCDLGLPDLDGCEVARRLRSDTNEAVAHSRLIALSGFARPEDVERARSAGFDAHLSKPPSLEGLQALLAPGPDGL